MSANTDRTQKAMIQPTAVQAERVRQQPFLQQRSRHDERRPRQQRHERAHESGEDQQDGDGPVEDFHSVMTPQQAGLLQGRRSAGRIDPNLTGENRGKTG
jgi:hypothetical protein